MNTYEIKKVTAGNVDWTTVPEISLDCRYPDTPDDVRVFAKIGYSDEALCVYLRTVERAHRAEEVGPLGEPYHDSCLEFFFRPDPDSLKYFNFEFNSNKCLYLGYGENLKNSARLIVNVEEIFAPVVKFLDDGWEIKYTIPYSFVRLFCPTFSPRPGSAIRANCYKCADMMEPPHYLSWNLVTSEDNFTYHKPECFGLMTFGE